MRVLYVDISLYGHRIKYIEALCKVKDYATEVQLLLPKYIDSVAVKQHELTCGFWSAGKNGLKYYIAFLKEVRKVVKNECIDCVHFLCGDALYRFFGLGLNRLGAKVVITYHHVVLDLKHRLSLKIIFRNSQLGIVHTQMIADNLIAAGMKNVRYIDYPMMDQMSQKNCIDAKKAFGLPQDIPVVGALGGTSYYKGLDILLDALNQINKKCCLFIGGSRADFTEDDIHNRLRNKEVTLVMRLRKLSDEEFADAIQATDIIVLPYRREFDGASGIMISAAFHKKTILGAEHGSMGKLIEKYGLGQVFETENVNDLRRKLELQLNRVLVPENNTEEFCSLLGVERFISTHKEIYRRIIE